MSIARYETEGEIAILSVDYPPVNALSGAVREELGTSLERAREDEAVRAVIIMGAGRMFIAGADIMEIGTSAGHRKPSLADLQTMLETFPKLTIAAIHGVALGAGLELALAAAARVAVGSAKVGLPEVNLGIPPGTQRLARLIGVEAALDVATSGRHVPAGEALEMGILDAVVDDLRAGAISFARQALAEGQQFRPVITRGEQIASVDPALFDAYRAKLSKKARGRTAPLVIVDCVEKATQLEAVEGLAYEAARFAELRGSSQHAALKHYFFAERDARKIPGLHAAPRPVRSAAVIGSGTMGGGIAMVFANVGIPVVLLDINDDALGKGMATIRRNYEISVERGSMTQAAMEQALALITPSIHYDDLAQVDIAIEAVFENMDLKRRIFGQLDSVMKPGAILATNTSTLSIDAIAEATSRPEDVIGVHFFSPATAMKLQENIRGAASSPVTIATVMALGKTLGKNVVLAGNCDGFIGNRMLQYYTGEAEFLLEQGATPEQVDRVAERFGMPMGPIALRDLSGLDIGALVREQRRKTLPAGERFSPVLERLVERGRLGMKTGRGFYRYEGRQRFSDPETLQLIEEVSAELEVPRRSFTDDEIEFRLFAPLVNEGAKELEDGTALRAGDIDVVWVNGYGFPAHKGGPMFWGERIGLDRIYQAAVDAAERNGPRWGPGPLLERLARDGRGWSGGAG